MKNLILDQRQNSEPCRARVRTRDFLASDEEAVTLMTELIKRLAKEKLANKLSTLNVLESKSSVIVKSLYYLLAYYIIRLSFKHFAFAHLLLTWRFALNFAVEKTNASIGI